MSPSVGLFYVFCARTIFLLIVLVVNWTQEMIFGFRFHFNRGLVLRRITWNICFKILDVFGCCGGRRSARPSTQTTVITETKIPTVPPEHVKPKTTSQQWIRHPYQYQSFFSALIVQRNVIREATIEYITTKYTFNSRNVHKFI